jgi:hypothetical protein
VEQIKRIGPKAGSLKYDLLTALSVAGLHGSPTEQTSLMRLNALITARYNWRLEEVSVGQVELARLWSVNERTVKREMKRLIGLGILSCIRPGVRGRVGAYRLNYRRIYEFSRPCWIAVGPDFEDRMMEMSGERTVVSVDFQSKQPIRPSLVPDSEPQAAGTWGAVRRRLKAEDTALYESWFAKLVEDRKCDRALILRAPNGFVARYIETHFAKKLALAVDAEMPTPDGLPRRITLTV